MVYSECVLLSSSTSLQHDLGELCLIFWTLNRRRPINSFSVQGVKHLTCPVLPHVTCKMFLHFVSHMFPYLTCKVYPCLTSEVFHIRKIIIELDYYVNGLSRAPLEAGVVDCVHWRTATGRERAGVRAFGRAGVRTGGWARRRTSGRAGRRMGCQRWTCSACCSNWPATTGRQTVLE